MVLRRPLSPFANPQARTICHRANFPSHVPPCVGSGAGVQGSETQPLGEKEANEPTEVKYINANRIGLNWKKRTQRGYLACFQQLNHEKGPILATASVLGAGFEDLPLCNCHSLPLTGDELSAFRILDEKPDDFEGLVTCPIGTWQPEEVSYRK